MLQTAATWGVGGLSASVGFFFVRSIIVIFLGRLSTKEAQVDAGTQLLITQLQAQVKDLIAHKETVETKLAECLERDIEKERRIAQLEGLTAGLGDARQHAALIVAAEHEAAKRKGGDKG